MKTIGKFLVKGKKRTIYTVDDKKYYYRTKKGKHYINKPRDYKKKYSKYKFNKGSKSKSFDVYIDKNPKDTIPIKYSTLEDTKKTIKKLERLFKTKKYSHKRIWQVGMILHVRLRAMKGKKREKSLAKSYFQFLKKKTKKKTYKERKELKFKI